MIRFTEYLIMALLCGAQVIEQLQGAPNDKTVFPIMNETTTAIPLYNVSDSSASGHTSTGTFLIPTVASTTGQSTTKATFDSETSTLAKLTKVVVSPMTPATNGYQRETEQHNFYTTTAAPPFADLVPLHRQFDALSFIGGALLTICLVIIGTLVWKMYIAHLERRYWTI